MAVRGWGKRGEARSTRWDGCRVSHCVIAAWSNPGARSRRLPGSQAERAESHHPTQVRRECLTCHQRELDELAHRFERLRIQPLAELASNRRSRDLVLGRMELTALAVGRYGLRSCQVAKLIDKSASTVARWLQLGLRLEKEDPSFRRRLDFLDRAISPRPENATTGYVAP